MVYPLLTGSKNKILLRVVLCGLYVFILCVLVYRFIYPDYVYCVYEWDRISYVLLYYPIKGWLVMQTVNNEMYAATGNTCTSRNKYYKSYYWLKVTKKSLTRGGETLSECLLVDPLAEISYCKQFLKPRIVMVATEEFQSLFDLLIYMDRQRIISVDY
jgi:hypothetical protein